MRAFTVGEQPCNDFRAEIEGNAYATWDNEHECYAPFEPGKPKCGGVVSWCANCRRDHHDQGYETCLSRKLKIGE